MSNLKPLRRSYQGVPLADRFWLYVDRSAGADECWPWTGGLGRGGYGRFNVSEGDVVYAHRFSFAQHQPNTSIDGQYVCHHCDNPPCCNPGHLFLGAALENNQDMASKGRHWMQGHSHCKRGHAYTSENTLYFPSDGGSRRCRQCVEIQRKKHNLKRRNAVKA